ncbi:MAG: hypothetical protein WCA81_20395 [Rhizomicrobium sp.]
MLITKEGIMQICDWLLKPVQSSRIAGIALGSVVLLALAPCAAQVLALAGQDASDITLLNHSDRQAHIELYEDAASCSGDTAVFDGIQPGSQRDVKVTARPEQAVFMSLGSFIGGCKVMFSFPMEKMKKYTIHIGEGGASCPYTVTETSGSNEIPVAATERRMTRRPSALCAPKE